MSIARLLFLVSIAVSITFACRQYVAEPIYVATASMEPTLKVGQRLITDKLSLRRRPPKRGEYVLFHSPVGEDIDLVKRVIALPGETVALKEKKVFINGVELDEPYAAHKRAAERLVGDNLDPITVPDGDLFVLGDNRGESEDSSVWKDASGKRVYFIKIAELKGLVRDIY